MRSLKKLWFVLLLAGVLGTPSWAQAQIRTFGGSGPGYRGGYGGYYGGNYGRYPGTYGNLYGPNWAPGVGGFGAMGYMPNWAPGMPGYGMPGYGMPGGMPSNSGLPYYSGMAIPNTAGTILSPGFGPTEAPRMRASLYPAIPQPPKDIVAASLEPDDKERARIEIRVPAANARVYLDGVLTKQTGLDRIYMTPKLNPNTRYYFNVEVMWQDASGANRTVRRDLSLRAGATSEINLRDD